MDIFRHFADTAFLAKLDHVAHIQGHQAIYGGDEGLRHHLCLHHDEHFEPGEMSRDELEERHEEEHPYNGAHRGEWGCPDHHEENEPTEFSDMHEAHGEIGDIHRGIGVDLPDGLHKFVHDRRRRVSDRAQALLDHVSEHPGHWGTHWTTDERVAEDFGEKSARGYATGRKPGTSVVFHAASPDPEHVDRNPNRWGNGDVYGYSEHGEREVPVSHSGNLDLKRISWAPVHDDWDKPHDREYTRHEFEGHEPREAVARPGRGEKKCPCCTDGTHADGTPCAACGGTGSVGRSEDPGRCPGQPQPKRRHWRQGASIQAVAEPVDEGMEILGHFEAAGYSMQHTAPGPAAGHLPLHHYTGGSPGDHVQVYRSAPAGTESINPGDWISLNSGYAHQHGRHATDSSKDWPVYTASVPQRHVHWDENDENEHGYNGPAIRHPDVHDEETGAHHDWDDWHEAHPHGQEAWAGGAVHLPQAEHDFVHDDCEWEPDRADTVLAAAREQGALRRARWHDDLYPARDEAEARASAITPPEGRRLTTFTVHRTDSGQVGDVAVHPYEHGDEGRRRYRNMDMEEHFYEHPAVGDVGKGEQRTAACELPPPPPREYSAGRMRVSDILVPGEGRLSERPYSQDELAGDIRRNGVQQPVAVEHLPAHGGPTSFNGMHRLDAAKRAGVPDVPVVVKHLPGQPPAMTERRASTEQEFNAAFDLERSGRWAGQHEAALEVTAGAEDYGISHRPVDDLDQFHDLGDHTFPEYVYEHPEYFPDNPQQYGTEHIRQMRAARGNPDHPVKVYRAMHQDAPREVNPGDWVATSRRYADFHAETQGYPANDWHVVSATVPARHIRSGAGSDLHEWGYWGPRVSAEATSASQPARRKASRQGDGEERPFGYYTLRHRTEDMGEAKPRHFIEAITPEDRVAGRMNWFGTTGWVHHIDVAGDEDDTANGMSSIGDGRDHQGRGLATAMWDWSQEMRPKARHSKDQTDQGREWARGLKARERRDPPEGPPRGGPSQGETGAARRSFEAALAREEAAVPADDYTIGQVEAAVQEGRTFYHGTPGEYSFKPGDLLTPGAKPTVIGGYAKHVYYTSDLASARTYAGYSQPRKPNGRVDWDAEALPGHVYAVQPETAAGNPVRRHAEDPYSGVPGNASAYRTKGRLRVLHEVDKETGEPLDAPRVASVPAGPGGDLVAHFGDDEDDYDPADFDHPEHGNFDEEHGVYHHPAHGYWCHACEDYHDDAETASAHHSSWTDWTQVHPGLPSHMHRGFATELPGHLHDAVHDEDRPGSERAGLLLSHLGDEHGTHWTPSRDQAEHYAGVSAWQNAGNRDSNGSQTQVVLHARKPHMDDIETEPDELASQDVISYGDHDDSEIPIRRSAPVHLTGVSWRRGTEPWTRHELAAPAEHMATLDVVGHFEVEGKRWYHGTRWELQPGQQMEGGRFPSNQGYGQPGDHVYYSGKPSVAAFFADAGSGPEEHDWEGTPRVYQVEPDHTHEADPDEPEADSWRSRNVRVIREVPWQPHWSHQGALEAVAEASGNPPCLYCGHPLDDSDVHDGTSAHEECSDMRWCEACQEHHDDPSVAEDHNETYTDWGNHLPFEGGIHRGITVRLPHEVHGAVHDGSRPPGERAAILGRHLAQEPLGVHWTDHEGVARNWGSAEGALFSPDEQRTDPAWTHVVMHAASPDEDHIETDPEALSERDMLGFDHRRSEREVPIRSGAPVTLTGLSWKRAGHPDWQRHDIPATVAHTAALEAAGHLDDDDDEEYGHDDEEGEGSGDEDDRYEREQAAAEAARRSALPYVEPPREGELREHMHHMHGMDSQTSDLHMSPQNQQRWHDSEHRYRTNTTHQHDALRGLPGEAQWPDVFQPSEHTDFYGGTPRRNGEFERVLHDPAASRPFRPLAPSESSLHMPVVAHFEAEAAATDPDGETDKERIQRIREERRNRPARRAGEPRPDPLAGLWSPIPPEELEAQRKAREPRPERTDDRDYSIDQVSRHYDWEGFDPQEISHLVHHPEHATFTREDVPVHSLRHVDEHGALVAPPSYRDIASQGEDEQHRLEELERGYDQGDPVPPIVAVRDGEHHIIADGSHRAAVHANQGSTHVPAFVTQRTIYPGQHTAALEGPPGGTVITVTAGDDGALDWSEIAARHPRVYGEHDYNGYDGTHIADAAAELYHDRPGHPYSESAGELNPAYGGEMKFHPRTVDPRRIDYIGADPGDQRVQRARRGYEGQQPEKVPPLILVHRHGVYNVADGHHRAKAAFQAGKPVRAYVAYSPHDEPFAGRDGEPPQRAPFHGAETEDREPYPDQNGVRRRISYPGFPHAAEAGTPHVAALEPVVAHFEAEAGRMDENGFHYDAEHDDSEVHLPPPYAGQQLYHGTRSMLEPGEMLTPGDAARHPSHPLPDDGSGYVHATPHYSEARYWGEHASPGEAGRRMTEMGLGRQPSYRNQPEHELYPPRVYEVHPSGAMEPDPNGEGQSYRSASPMRVGREVYPLQCHECEAEHLPGHPHHDAMMEEEREEEEDRRGLGQAEREEAADEPEPEAHAAVPAGSHPGDEAATAEAGSLEGHLRAAHGYTSEDIAQAAGRAVNPRGRRNSLAASHKGDHASEGFEHWEQHPHPPLAVSRRADGGPTRAAPDGLQTSMAEHKWRQSRQAAIDAAVAGHEAAFREDPDDEDDSGDDYTTCDQGHAHWGTHGAAGLLVRHRGDDGQARFLLQHRSPHVQHGSTWSTPGGAMRAGEAPEHAALREATEELGELPRDLAHHHTHVDDHGGWAYHTVVMDSPRQFHPGGGEDDWEHAGHGWFTPAEMNGLDLHPGFQKSWAQVRKSGVIQAGPDQVSAREERGDRWHEFGNRYSDDLHRGIHVELPGALHGYVHDESVPREDRARALEQHLAESGHGLGMHWTPHLNIANRSVHNALDDDDRETEHDPDDEYGYDPDNRKTFVMLHVQRPGERNRLRDPEELRRREVGHAYSPDEDEFPVKPGSPLRLSGISWKEHDPDHPMEPYEHVDFPKPVRHVSSAQAPRPVAAIPARPMIDCSVRDVVLRKPTPLPGIATALAAVASWTPASAAEAREALEDFPGLFEALEHGLDALAGHLDECPVSEGLPAIIRRMAAACLSAADDARQVAGMPLGDPTEGTWTGPHAGKA